MIACLLSFYTAGVAYMALWCVTSGVFASVIVPLKECLVSPVVVDKRSCDNGTAVAVCCPLMIFSCVGVVLLCQLRGILVFSL